VDFPSPTLAWRRPPIPAHSRGNAIHDAADELDERKAAVRADARANRDALAAGLGAAAAAGVAARFMSNDTLRAWAGAGCTVSGYLPIGSEIDPRALLGRIADAGAALCLPDVVAPDAPLAFRRWRPGDPVSAGTYGTSVPGPDAEPLAPDLLLVPLLAFDRGGHRLGYGGGYYDRTIAALRGEWDILAVGLAFSGQVRDDLPVGPNDARLDWIVTESAALPVVGQG
jgi:5-formyltetrahydrofolate cyclo-ligase